MSIDVKHIKVHSKKYNIDGEIIDAGVVTKLIFHYDNREITIGLSQGITLNDTYEHIGELTINSYIENLRNESDDKVMLHYWYMDEQEANGHKFLQLHGNVSGHNRLTDSSFIHTSRVNSYWIDYESGELIAQTHNTLYHCPLAYMEFERQNEKDPNHTIIAEYDEIKERYEKKRYEPEIEPGKVLLVISNFDEYYCHSLFYRPDENSERAIYVTRPHVGMYQDSYLITSMDYQIDLRYFPHYGNIEFYCERTDGKEWYIENIGDVVIYCETSVGQLRLDPHTRKKVSAENAEPENTILPGGDLYPAEIIE